MTPAPAWTKRMQYQRNSPRNHPGLWLWPLAMILAGLCLFLACAR